MQDVASLRRPRRAASVTWLEDVEEQPQPRTHQPTIRRSLSEAVRLSDEVEDGTASMSGGVTSVAFSRPLRGDSAPFGTQARRTESGREVFGFKGAEAHEEPTLLSTWALKSKIHNPARPLSQENYITPVSPSRLSNFYPRHIGGSRLEPLEIQNSRPRVEIKGPEFSGALGSLPQSAQDALHSASDVKLAKGMGYLRGRHLRLLADSDAVVDFESRLGIPIAEEDYQMLLKEEKEQQKMRSYLLFDLCFGSLIVGYVLFLGYDEMGQVNNDGLVALTDLILTFAIFLEAFVKIRCYKDTNWRDVLWNPWTGLDVSIAVAWAVQAFSSLDVTLAVLRVFRFVRLLNRFKALRILVSGFLGSLLHLTYLLAFLICSCYIAGVIMIESVGDYCEVEEQLHNCDEAHREYWSSMPRVMLSLAQIATFRGAPIIREILPANPLIVVICVMPFVAIASFGFINLIVGMMMIALRDTDRVELVEEALTRLQRHEGLHELQDVLMEYCRILYGKEALDDAVLTRELLKSWITVEYTTDREPEEWEPDTKKVKDCMTRAGITWDEIDTIFNEVAMVHRREVPISVVSFVEGIVLLHGYNLPIDNVSATIALVPMYQTLCSLQEILEETCNEFEDIINQLRPILDRHADDQKPEKDHVADFMIGEKAREQEHLTIEAQAVRVKKHMEAHLRASLVDRLDNFFIWVVIGNCVAMGRQLWNGPISTESFVSRGYTTTDAIWLFIEFFFWCAYTFELVVRTGLHYQMEELDDFRVYAMIPAVFNNIGWDDSIGILKHSRKLFSDPFYCLDVFVVFTGTLDNWVLRFFPTGQLGEMIKVFSVIRILRLSKPLYRQRALRVLILGFLDGRRIFCWTIFLVFVVSLMCGQSMVFVVKSFNVEGEAFDTWGSGGRALGALLELATFNDWGKKLEQVADVKKIQFALVILGLYMLTTGLGLLNLLTGTMVKSALQVLQVKTKDRAELKVGKLRLHTEEALERAFSATSKFAGSVRGTMKETLEKMRDEVYEYKIGMLKKEAETLKRPKSDGKPVLQDQRRQRQDRQSAENNTTQENKGMDENNLQVDELLHPLYHTNKHRFASKMSHPGQDKGKEDDEAHEATWSAVSDTGEEAVKSHKATFKPPPNYGVPSWLEDPRFEDLGPAEGASAFNSGNYCVVRDSFWITPEPHAEDEEDWLEGGIAIYYKLVTNLKEGPITSPTLSEIGFGNGGRRNPVLCSYLGKAKRHIFYVTSAGSRRDLQEVKKTYRIQEGCLVFSNIPMAKRLTFKFGGNFASMDLCPIDTVVIADSKQVRLFRRNRGKNVTDEIRQILSRQKTVIRAPDLTNLIYDPIFQKTLTHHKLRIQQVQLVFQSLNVMGTGEVPRESFVDAVVKLKALGCGLDVARCKSQLRLLILSTQDLMKLASKSFGNFTTVVNSLRHVRFSEHPKVVWQQEVNDGADAFAEQNVRLRDQVDKISRFVDQKKASWLKYNRRFEDSDRAPDAAEDEEDWGAEEDAFDFIDSSSDNTQSSDEDAAEGSSGSETDPEEHGGEKLDAADDEHFKI